MAIDLNSLSGSLTSARVRTSAQPIGKEEVSKAEPQAAAAQVNIKHSSKSDSVQLSGEALRLNSRAQSAPEIDERKVSAIKTSIEDGTYKIDYQALAKNIIQFEDKL